MDITMFEAAIFDWDGTLADTKKVIVTSFQRALNEINCYPKNKLIERLIGIGSAQTFKEILKSKKVVFDEELIEFLVRNKVKSSIALSREIELFKGSKELLRILEKKLKLGLASMNKREFIDLMLKKFRLADLFEAIVTADEVIKVKPDPEIFLKCAKMMHIKPEKCVVIEDSIFGIRAAKTGGMSCIAVLTGVYGRDEIITESPDLIVNSLMEKQKILNFFFQE
jgi:beta-phosphoglucomutase